MKKRLTIDAEVLKRLGNLSKDERLASLEALWNLAHAFGQPHIHSGISIRKLRDKLFECRINMALRFLFKEREDDLYVVFVGDHDDVRKVLKQQTYE